MSFPDELVRRARRLNRTIAFAEGDDVRVQGAVAELRRGGIAEPVVAGGGGVESLATAVAMLRRGEVDGVVAGAVLTSADVIRAALRGVRLRSGVRTLSSSFYIEVADFRGRGAEVLTFTDAAVVPEPDARQLAAIALEAARARQVVVGDEPRVAFLSYSTLGSAGGPAVERVRDAVRLFRASCPGVAADGELQGDAALIPEVAATKSPGSEVAGRANTLVFPSLSSGNIAYKLVERLAGARALGPILQGLRAPLNDLSRGASSRDITLVAAITALLAGTDPTS
ncbi:MAG: phosphate acyltransferase [Gemmatimonadetes bacterium]|nr:phosphate acyltransferase [Gemmatimonadota bacterium]MCY3943876.1 phosphate acyltransferase [Gemmatimonadota bacterium]